MFIFTVKHTFYRGGPTPLKRNVTKNSHFTYKKKKKKKEKKREISNVERTFNDESELLGAPRKGGSFAQTTPRRLGSSAPVSTRNLFNTNLKYQSRLKFVLRNISW